MTGTITRRSMVAASLALTMAKRAPAVAVPDLPGVQLFAIADALQRDPVAALGRVAALGYRSVETVGAFGGDPARWRAMLDRAGLRSPAQHIMPRALWSVFAARATQPPGVLKRAWLAAFAADGLDATVQEAVAQARALGQRCLVWQVLWPEQIADAAQIRATCRLLDRAAALCADAGLRFALHNQAPELERSSDAYTRIVADTDPRVLLEVDIAAMLRARRDPAALLRLAPERVRLAHIRDAGAAMSLPAMLAMVARAGVADIFLDYERLADPFAQLAADRAKLRGTVPA